MNAPLVSQNGIANPGILICIYLYYIACKSSLHYEWSPNMLYVRKQQHTIKLAQFVLGLNPVGSAPLFFWQYRLHHTATFIRMFSFMSEFSICVIEKNGEFLYPRLK